MDEKFKDFSENLNQNQLNEFEQFLFKSSRYNQIDQMSTDAVSTRANTVILMKEVPSAAYYNDKRFKEILCKFMRYSKSLLVIACDSSVSGADSWSTNPAKLFTNELKSELKISEITFNSFANRFLTNALTRIIQLEGLSINKETLDDLCSSCNGDLRFAINSLEFYFTNNNGIGRNTYKNGNNFKTLIKNNVKDLNLNLFKGQ